ncbi:conserved Plasmodium protein, unknown function [Plasmodium berghei]|uniref:Uncharacterized protein n=2 Tax=Plasmodium berghei TaxID=5821 RepID=A0A509AK05_PLABA|nr:conserved Plasmodium protein, unknown function [Plasmodium berghei ANKA]SCM20172.1 conserved Plasmodium protein, unknown function [Plasmodium berghei]SCN23804.1 conserved Plasmodium protein, unknown function [Plasmodium berghei]SCO59246.1 conserved Plasmodium protein, unknown function [Plasmodium berghei]SCO60185.1 conserved Plasmodium protein, unknown function [Plasmodium berghei]VUC54965.1 conserved Plasmodium protein, unknown function [Plasmodium berghei ANKA]|eukprot:XP_034420784.1 conserved Plasmodium protein, unknown function [Plasmodium berghei ANKA]
MAKESAKELFRQMKNELSYNIEKPNCLDLISCAMSSEYDDFKTYHNEIKYLKKEQLKAYICKLRKEIKNYKNKELNYIIEIKYLRRKIIRLQNVIENDKVLKRDEIIFFLNHEKRGYSLKNYNNNMDIGLNENVVFTDNSFNHKNRQNSFNRSGTPLIYNNYNNNNNNSRVRRQSYGYNSCFKSDSIRSINHDIHKGKRIVDRKNLWFDNKKDDNYEIYNGIISKGIAGSKGKWTKIEKENGNKKIIHTIKPIEKVYSCGEIFDNNKKSLNSKNYDGNSDKYRNDRYEHSLYNLNLYKNPKNICSEKGEKKETFISNRSYSSASKFELKRHLISNSKNMNRMSSHINSIIEKDINKYNNSKENILHQRNEKTILKNNFLNGLEYGNKHRSCSSIHSNLIMKKYKNIEKTNTIKVNKNTFDIYNDAYHQKVLSKKYTSPYAYQNSGKASSNKYSNKKNYVIRRNIKNVETKFSKYIPNENNILENENLDKLDKKNKVEKNIMYYPHIENVNQLVENDYMDIKSDIKRGTYNNLIKEYDSDNIKLEEDCNSSSSINKIKKYFQNEKKKKKKKKSGKKANKTVEKENVYLKNEEKDKNKKNNNWGTTLKWKERQTSEKSKTCINHITKNETNSIDDNNNNNNDKNNRYLSNLKKVIQSDLKENFKQELEKLKKRNNILISKPHVYCDIPFDSTSGGSEKDNYSNRNNNNKIIETKNQNKININYLKGPNISNTSLNDIEQRINNLQNYLKKNKK